MNLKNSLAVVVVLIIVYLGVSNGESENNNRKFNFSYSVNFEPTNGKKFEAWIPYPQSNEVQNISNISINTDLKYEILSESKHGNKYVYLYELDGLSANVDFELTCDVDRIENKTVNFSNVDQMNYLSGTSQVVVGSVFDNIISENNLSSEDMRNIYDYVLNGMHYGKPTDNMNSKNYKYVHGGKNPNTGKEWLPDDIVYGRKKITKENLVKSQNKNEKYAYGNGNSLYACDIGVGNCTDYHSYFISLSRTMNVPARFHMGFPIPSGDEGKVGGYHCWADFYKDGEGWTPVDISEADKAPQKADYFYGTLCENRVEFMVGRDFKLKNYNSGEVNIFIYPIVEVGDVDSDNFSKSFYFKNL